MANTFDWEKYEKVSPQEAEFDWEKYENPPTRTEASSLEEEKSLIPTSLSQAADLALFPTEYLEKYGGKDLPEKIKDFAIEEGIPMAGAAGVGLAGTMLAGPAGTIGGGGVGYAAGKELVNKIKGAPPEESSPEKILENIATGMLYETGGLVAGKGLQKAGEYIAPKLSKFAEKMALKSTGATPRQVSKFQEGAGRELLEGGYVKVGDTVENIAERLNISKKEAESIIDNVLKDLDSQGVKIDQRNIISELEKKVEELKPISATARDREQLAKIIDDIKYSANLNLPEGVAGPTLDPRISASISEINKRKYNEMAGYFQEPNARQAGKEAYQVYRRATEEAAEAANPEIANLFKEQKKIYGLLSPIEEATGRAALREQQSGLGLFKSAEKLALERAPATLAVGANLASKATAATTPMIAKTIEKIVPPLSIMVKEASQPKISTGDYSNTKSVMSMSPQEWSDLSNKLEGPLKEKALMLSGEDVPEAKRRAVIFSLLQDPAFRKTIQPER
jgi:hypothetical protein